jgi:signal peptidase
MQGLLHRPARTLWSALLTLSAVVGTLCLLATMIAPMLGIRPLIFLSGSMGPEIPAGSLAMARTVGADDLKVGDVVTVPANGSYVTHRIVELTHGPGRATLLLKGDANEVPDAQAYVVTSAPRTFFSVPQLGGVVAWFSHTPGVYVLALWVALVLGSLRRGDRTPKQAPRPAGVAPRSVPALWSKLAGPFTAHPRRRGLIPVHAFLGVVLVAPWVAPTATLASDVEPPTSAAPSEDVVTVATAPKVPLIWCHRATSREVTVSWTPVAGATSYRLVLDGAGDTRVDVPADTTSRTFRDRAHGTVAVKAVSGTGMWISQSSNSLRYETTGKGSCR